MYLTRATVPSTGREAIRGVIQTLAAKEEYAEHALKDLGLVVYDPTGSVQRPEDGPPTRQWFSGDAQGNTGVWMFSPIDRSRHYRKKVGLKYRSPGVAIVTHTTQPNAHTNARILRLFRPADDRRVIQKVLRKAGQLGAEVPSVVVVDMGGSTALFEDWVPLVDETFRSGAHGHPSAVWIREAVHGSSIYRFRDALITNDRAVVPLPSAVVDEWAEQTG